MLKKVKKTILASFVLAVLFFILAPAEYPDNFQFRKSLYSVQNEQVVIIFNAGGWGYTPLEKADDLAPIVLGTQDVLSDMGHSSVVIPYKRTKNSVLGKIESSRDLLLYFDTQATNLVSELEHLLQSESDSRVIITGLSNGAAFTDSIMERIPPDIRDRVLAIEVGLPFWDTAFDNENVLSLDNNGQDAFSKLRIGTFLGALIKTPFKWLLAKVSGENLSLGHAMYVPGHQYYWESPSVKENIISFLNEKL
jgi:hypothetical protein